MKKLPLLALVLSSLALFGCAFTRPQSAEFLHRDLNDQDELLSSPTEALAAFQQLQESDLFPWSGIAKVEVSDVSLNLGGPLTIEGSAASRNFAMKIPELSETIGESASASTSVETTSRRSIWFKDIRAVEISHFTPYEIKDEDVTGGTSYYQCVLVMTEGTDKLFVSPSGKAVHRLAAAFSYYSHRPISKMSPLDKVGLSVDPGTGCVVTILEDSPASNEGIKVFDRIVKVDGKATRGGQLNAILDGLMPGEHSLVVQSYGSFKRVVIIDVK